MIHGKSRDKYYIKRMHDPTVQVSFSAQIQKMYVVNMFKWNLLFPEVEEEIALGLYEPQFFLEMKAKKLPKLNLESFLTCAF